MLIPILKTGFEIFETTTSNVEGTSWQKKQDKIKAALR